MRQGPHEALPGGQSHYPFLDGGARSSALSSHTFNHKDGEPGEQEGGKETDRSRGRQTERQSELASRQSVCPGQGTNLWLSTPPHPQLGTSAPTASHARSTARTGSHSTAMKRRVSVCSTAPKCKPISSFRESPKETRIRFNVRRKTAVRQLKRLLQISPDHRNFLPVLALWNPSTLHSPPG